MNDSALPSLFKDKDFLLIDNKIFSYLPEVDIFYEGAYLNKVHFIPKSEKWYHVIPIWLINNGYLWNVRSHLPPNALVLELGCASGVNYFGHRYEMIGLDLSLASLRGLDNYRYALQADASNLPLQDNSVDGIISSYFWEHIPPPIKDKMLEEFQRVLKPGGKIVFLYDVATENGFINIIKRKDLHRYNQLFLEGDGHLGYETPEVNRQRFEQHGFEVQKHFGMERSWLQSQSVYEKYRHLPGLAGWIGKLGYFGSRSRILTLLHIFIVRLVDETIGRVFSQKKSRILISVLSKKS